MESQLADWTTRCTTLERRLTHALDELQSLAHRGANASVAEEVAESQELRTELQRERDKCTSYEIKVQVLEDKLKKLREEQPPNGTSGMARAECAIYRCVSAVTDRHVTGTSTHVEEVNGTRQKQVEQVQHGVTRLERQLALERETRSGVERELKELEREMHKLRVSHDKQEREVQRLTYENESLKVKLEREIKRQRLAAEGRSRDRRFHVHSMTDLIRRQVWRAHTARPR